MFNVQMFKMYMYYNMASRRLWNRIISKQFETKETFPSEKSKYLSPSTSFLHLRTTVPNWHFSRNEVASAKGHSRVHEESQRFITRILESRGQDTLQCHQNPCVHLLCNHLTFPYRFPPVILAKLSRIRCLNHPWLYFDHCICYWCVPKL